MCLPQIHKKYFIKLGIKFVKNSQQTINRKEISQPDNNIFNKSTANIITKGKILHALCLKLEYTFQLYIVMKIPTQAVT